MSATVRRGSGDPAADGESPLDVGRRVIQQEGAALLNLAAQLDGEFVRAVDRLESCAGSVIVSGIGKAGLIGQKIAATFASTGTRSHFLHPVEALHGDLGRVHADDVVLMLSHSGETEEVLCLLPFFAEMRVSVLAITGRPHSRLARQASVVLSIGTLQEAGRLKLAPSTSTTAMLALGDALALATSQRRGFAPQDFARFHPGGALGRKLARVEDVMRPLHACRVAQQDLALRHVLVSLGRPGRRCGAILVIDVRGKLTGIFTDSDLARLLEREQDQLLDGPIRHVMTNSPTAVPEGTMMAEAVGILTERKISELPVTDDQGRPIGLIDITDVVAFLPRDQAGPEYAGTLPSSPAASDGRPVPGPSPVILPLTNQGGAKRVDET